MTGHGSKIAELIAERSSAKSATPRRDAAVALLNRHNVIAAPPHLFRMRASGILTLNLQGNVGTYNQKSGKGILAAHVRKILTKYPRASHIDVTINSPGGSVKDALEIYSLLRAHGGHVTTIADGLCGSAATIILMAGDLRQVWPGSQLLFHLAASSVQTDTTRWTAAAHRRRAIALERANAKLLNIYAERCGNKSFFEREMKTEKDLPITVAKAHGVIHCFVGEERWMDGKPHTWP